MSETENNKQGKSESNLLFGKYEIIEKLDNFIDPGLSQIGRYGAVRVVAPSGATEMRQDVVIYRYTLR